LEDARVRSESGLKRVETELGGMKKKKSNNPADVVFSWALLSFFLPFFLPSFLPFFFFITLLGGEPNVVFLPWAGFCQEEKVLAPVSCPPITMSQEQEKKTWTKYTHETMQQTNIYPTYLQKTPSK